MFSSFGRNRLLKVANQGDIGKLQSILEKVSLARWEFDTGKALATATKANHTDVIRVLLNEIDYSLEHLEAAQKTARHNSEIYKLLEHKVILKEDKEAEALWLNGPSDEIGQTVFQWLKRHEGLTIEMIDEVDDSIWRRQSGEGRYRSDKACIGRVTSPLLAGDNSNWPSTHLEWSISLTEAKESATSELVFCLLPDNYQEVEVSDVCLVYRIGRINHGDYASSSANSKSEVNTWHTYTFVVIDEFEKDYFDSLLKMLDGEDQELVKAASAKIPEILNKPTKIKQQVRQAQFKALLEVRSSNLVDVLIPLLEQCYHYDFIGRAVIIVIKKGELARLFDALDRGTINGRVRQWVLSAIMEQVVHRDPKSMMKVIQSLLPEDDTAILEVPEVSHLPPQVLARYGEDSLLDALKNSNSYHAIRFLCNALSIVGTEKSLDSLTHIPQIAGPRGYSDPATPYIAQLARKNILERLDTVSLENLGKSENPTLQSEAMKVLTTEQGYLQAEIELNRLRSDESSEKLDAMKNLSKISEFKPHIKEQVIETLLSIIQEEKDIDLRSNATNGLRKLGIKPPVWW